MAALSMDINPGDEIIVSPFNYGVANAFAMFGAKLVFVDIEPNTMNINLRPLGEPSRPRPRQSLRCITGV